MENETTTGRYTQMSDDEITASIASEVCAACLKFKRKGQAFCTTDYSALSLPARLVLGEHLQEGFRSALQHLRLHVERRRTMGEDGWNFRSQEELEHAGYYLARPHFRCEVPVPGKRPYTCGARVSLWRTPNKGLLAIDDRTFRPHRPDCIDPDYYQRKREARVQTSARKRRKGNQ